MSCAERLAYMVVKNACMCRPDNNLAEMAATMLDARYGAPPAMDRRANDDVRRALNTTASQHVRRLPVVDDDGKLVGILSIDDLLLH
jgi:CBS domain-containing protein